jgi:NAD(P)-dependent dehydrogenase (short-subunit alcohol dehydrogenase family)
MVTGGSSGIGLAIAQRFLCEGAERIIVVGTNKIRLLRAFEQLRSLDESLCSKREGMPTKSGDKDTVENGSDTTGLKSPMQQQPHQGAQIESPKQVSFYRSQAPSSLPSHSQVGFDTLAYDTKQGEKSVRDAISDADCELIDWGRFAIAVGDVGNSAFWGDRIKKIMVSLPHLPFICTTDE